MVVNRMAKLNPFLERPTGTMRGNLGKVLLFCEGHTEKNYFNHFATIVNNNRNKYSHMEIVPLLAGGNARRVLNYADEYLADDHVAKKFSLYEKYLVFDCDDPTDIQQVIVEMQKSKIYILLLSNFVFEIWLLMHFENVEASLTKAKTYGNLAPVHLVDDWKRGLKEQQEKDKNISLISLDQFKEI